MADYHFPTVVDAELAIADMTPLERLILCAVFDAEEIGDDRLYLYAEVGPGSVAPTTLRELRAAHAASAAIDSAANAAVAAILARHDAADDVGEEDIVDVDLSEAEFNEVRILQDIVRRSTVLDEIVVWSAFTCTRMRRDVFGGSVTCITPDAVQYRSTSGMLQAMLNEAQPGVPPPLGDGRATQARLEAFAASAGWDGFTLTLQIARWLDRDDRARALLDHLAQLAADEAG